MVDGSPVNVRRGAFGTWFATRNEKRSESGLIEARSRFPVLRETAEQLETLYDSHQWRRAAEAVLEKVTIQDEPALDFLARVMELNRQASMDAGRES